MAKVCSVAGRSDGEGRGHTWVLGPTLQFPVLSAGNRAAGFWGRSEWKVWLLGQKRSREDAGLSHARCKTKV